MKTSIFAAFLLACLAALEITVSAATYTDDMTGAASDSVKRYSGFAPYTIRGSLPDRTALTFASYAGPSLSARADYRAEGAETVLVSLYSPYGTFVSQKGADVYLGVSYGTDISGQNLQQALLRRGSNEVYTNVGGMGKLYCSDPSLSIFQFNPVNELPGGLIGYGVHIGYSPDGQNFYDGALTHMGLDILQGSLCYERYAATVPPGTKYIRVELNDVTAVPLDSGGLLQKEEMASRFSALASVTISGGSLSMGEPEAAAALPSAGYYMGEGAASKGGRTGASPATQSESGGGGSNSKSSASSKFEGTITSSSKSGGAKEKTQRSAPKTEEKEEKSSSSSTSAEESRDETMVYQIRRDEDGGLLDGAVTLYIVIVSGALVLLVMLKRRQG